MFSLRRKILLFWKRYEYDRRKSLPEKKLAVCMLQFDLYVGEEPSVLDAFKACLAAEKNAGYYDSLEKLASSIHTAHVRVV